MSQKVIYFSSIILLIIFKFSNELYFEPDLFNPSIPYKWRQMCGRRYYGRKLDFAEQCFGRQFKDRFFPFSYDFIGPMNRVLGGRDVTTRESPWTVQIAARECFQSESARWCEPYAHECTGVLLTMKHVLTAAHCYNKSLEYKVFAGTDRYLPEPSPNVWTTESVTFRKHPGFNTFDWFGNPTLDYKFDLAIITFNNSINWEEYGRNEETGQAIINTICLPKEYGLSKSKTWWRGLQNAVIYGWGMIGRDTDPTILQRGDLLLKWTKYGWPYFTIDRDDNGQMTCQGDSGGGWVQYLDSEERRAVLIGIQSHRLATTWLWNCVKEDPRDGFAVVVEKHLPWIKERLRN